MMKKIITRFILIMSVLSVLLTNCSTSKEERLPILGERVVEGTDTIYHTIADFQFINQDSSLITKNTFKDKIYIADFFFTSCRTICPKMKTQMLRVYDSIQNMPDVLILSHTIDPEHDTVALLNDFARRLGVTSDKWHFVTGDKETIYHIAQTSYFTTAMEDKTDPDGFLHNGAFLLVDKQGRIRGFYDGTKPEEVDKLIKDIKKLKREYGA